ncbi:hypothetical protein EC362_22315 [Shigella sonnei]|nr:hypothetical protein [Shigella sonnei]EFX7987849.1 hypothetical protein [Shigella sonnei]EFX8022083.1 hypothetical protein [Shigella sonnei]EFX8154743.1 hypothetical protein [Shigella sonnei]EFX8294037.1 hypothetical protein [Shigella sonnei]
MFCLDNIIILFNNESLHQQQVKTTSLSSNRTCRFPASGSLATHQTFTFGQLWGRSSKLYEP